MYKINKIPHDLVETIDKYDELCKKIFREPIWYNDNRRIRKGDERHVYFW